MPQGKKVSNSFNSFPSKLSGADPTLAERYVVCVVFVCWL
jgi:hypothetical protein